MILVTLKDKETFNEFVELLEQSSHEFAPFKSLRSIIKVECNIDEFQLTNHSLVKSVTEELLPNENTQHMPVGKLASITQPLDVSYKIKKYFDVKTEGSWGLARICRKKNPFHHNQMALETQYNSSYKYTRTGVGCDCYVIDTFINPLDPEFEGRVTRIDQGTLASLGTYGLSYTHGAVPPDYDDAQNYDYNHGHMVMGCAIGAITGVAKGAEGFFTSIGKPAPLDGSGASGIGSPQWNPQMFSEMFDEILTRYLARNRPAVLNMSWTLASYKGDYNFSVFYAGVKELIDNGMILTLAVGNWGTDIDSLTDGTWEVVPHIIDEDIVIVGGSNIQDGPMFWLNQRSDLYYNVRIQAPAWAMTLRQNNAYYDEAGTSFAAPYVAGVLLCMMEGYERPVNRTQANAVIAKLLANAQKGVLKFPATQTAEPPNACLLYIDPDIEIEYIEGLTPLSTVQMTLTPVTETERAEPLTVGNVANSSNYAGFSPDYYVSTTSGSNAGSGLSEGDAFKTWSHALSVANAGDVIGFPEDITEDLSLVDIESNAGTELNPIISVGKSLYTKVNGVISSGLGIVDAYHEFHWLHFDGLSTTSGHKMHAKHLKCFNTIFQCSGNAVLENNQVHEAGSYQLYESCGFIGDAGRYISLCYQQTNTVYRWSLFRSELNVWTPDGGPTGGLNLYSSNNCGVVQCIGADCENQDSSTGHLGVFINTTNEGASSGIRFIENLAMDNTMAGFRPEGSSGTDASFEGCISLRNDWGLVGEGSGTVVTVTGGHYSDNVNRGIAAYGSASVTHSNTNTIGNLVSNTQDVSDGGGNTTNAYDVDAILSAIKLRGVSGTLFGETGWDTVQAGNLFPFPNEESLRDVFKVVSERGFCANGQTLSGYMGLTSVSHPAQTGDFYVGPNGDNSDGLTIATAFNDIDTAIPLCPNNGTIVVLDGYVGGIYCALLGQNAGTAGNFKTITGEYPNTKLYGCIGNWDDSFLSQPILDAYWQVRDILFMQQPYEGEQRYPYGAGASAGGSAQDTTDDLGCISDMRGTRFISMWRCGWNGARTNASPKNLVHGDRQCFDYCYAFGGGARYFLQGYEAQYTAIRRCVIRIDEGWLGTGIDNPYAAFQNYSCLNNILRQCIAIDAVAADPNESPLSQISVTFKAGGPAGNVAAIGESGDQVQCFAMDSDISGFHYEGYSSGTQYTVTDGNVVRRNRNGIYINNSKGANVVDIDNADARGNSHRGINNNDSGTVNVSNSNSVGNGGDNFGSGLTQTNNTSVAGNYDWEGVDIIGVEGTFHGEVGYDTIQTGEKLFGVGGSGFAHEAIIRDAFRMYTNPYTYTQGGYSAVTASPASVADRGFCAEGQTLTNYMWRDD